VPWVASSVDCCASGALRGTAMREPAEYADEIERDAALPAGSGERFLGY
jgi:hypothetical protein